MKISRVLKIPVIKEVVIAIIFFLIGSAWMYFDQKQETEKLLFDSRKLFEHQRLIIENQEEVYTLVINCGYDPQRCDPQTFLDKLDSLTKEKTKLDQEVEVSSKRVETTIKNNGWIGYEDNN